MYMLDLCNVYSVVLLKTFYICLMLRFSKIILNHIRNGLNEIVLLFLLMHLETYKTQFKYYKMLLMIMHVANMR